MIYVSSACVKNDRISESVIELAELGYNNIELSGGTSYRENIAEELLSLKQRYNLNYLVHNYFPAPKKDFVLNLASLDKVTFTQSYNHVKTAIDLSQKLGGKFIAFHAGFFIHVPLNQIGKRIENSVLFDQVKSEKQFYEAWTELCSYASAKNIEMYIENNVLSFENYKSHNATNPFMLTDLEWYHKIKKNINFNLLLDIGHLKVSTNTLSLDFEAQLKRLFEITNYIHVSDNDGLSDSNQGIGAEMFDKLRLFDWREKIVTLEIYESLDKLKDSYQKINDLINAQ